MGLGGAFFSFLLLLLDSLPSAQRICWNRWFGLLAANSAAQELGRV